MTQVRRTVSFSEELDNNLRYLAEKRNESLSALLEMALREHPMVSKQIEMARFEDSITDYGIRPRKGTRMYELLTRDLAQPSASGEEPPKPRRKGAAQP